jgi:hypothetical protein
MMIHSVSTLTAPHAVCPIPKSAHFPNSLMAEAENRGWIVVSMKNDWKVIFDFER